MAIQKNTSTIGSKGVLLFCLLSMPFLTAPNPVEALSPESLTPIEILNTTDFSIDTLFVSPGDSDYWGPQILIAESVLRPHESKRYLAHLHTATTNFDILAETSEGPAFIKWNFGISANSPTTVDITMIDQVQFPPQFTFITLKVRNKTTYDIHHLFLSPDDSAMWGLDLLRENRPLHSEDSLSLLIPMAATETHYDLLALDADNDHYTFTIQIDLSGELRSYETAIESDDYIAADFLEK